MVIRLTVPADSRVASRLRRVDKTVEESPEKRCAAFVAYLMSMAGTVSSVPAGLHGLSGVFGGFVHSGTSCRQGCAGATRFGSAARGLRRSGHLPVGAGLAIAVA